MRINASSCTNLTAWQVYNAFPDECVELVDKNISKLKRELRPWLNQYKSVTNGAYDVVTVNLILLYLDRIKPHDQFKLLAKLESVKEFMNRRKEFKYAILPVEEAKQVPILDMHDFKNIKKTGRRTMVSCPLHDDKSPSMLINTNNTFKCFSCGASGSGIDFMMKLYGCSFVDAVKMVNGLR